MEKLTKQEKIALAIIIAVVVYFIFFHKRVMLFIEKNYKKPGAAVESVPAPSTQETNFASSEDCTADCDRINNLRMTACNSYYGNAKVNCLEIAKFKRNQCYNACGVMTQPLKTIAPVKNAYPIGVIPGESKFMVPAYYYSGFPVDMGAMFTESPYVNPIPKNNCCPDKYKYGPNANGMCYNKIGQTAPAVPCRQNK